MKAGDWYYGTATHMWRRYMNIRRHEQVNGQKPDMSFADRTKYDICEKALSRIAKEDRDIVVTCFSSNRDYIPYMVENYSLKNNIPVKVVWTVIYKANRILMEELGLLDRKEEHDGYQ